MAPADGHRYRIPGCLRDLVMVDLLELTGSTTATAALLQLSQPSVSRRYRALALELGLTRGTKKPLGRRYGDTAWLELLRRGVNRHRLGCGVLRVGGPASQRDGTDGLAWIEWVELSGPALGQWPQLLRLELLDAVLLENTDDATERREPGRLEVVAIERAAAAPLLLICRPDPLVLEIAGRHGLPLELR